MAQVTELKTADDVQAMLDASHEQPVALLKHSIACPVSARGQLQFVGLEGPQDPPLYVVVVQYARDVSSLIAEKLGVRHETPQAIIIQDGMAFFVQNHSDIRVGALRDAAQEAAQAA